MDTPKVSVIIPVYNVKQYLKDCLESLIHQSLKDIEFILVDDGSTDGSQEILSHYATCYPQVIRLFTKKNEGAAEARNYGIAQATGEYIGFVDSDDLVDPQMFEKMYLRAKETGAECVVCDYLSFNEQGITKRKHLTPSSLYGSSIRNAPNLLYCSKPYVWNKLFDREMFINTGISFPKGNHFEDSAAIYNILLHANKIEVVPESLYHYRSFRPGAMTTHATAILYDIFDSMDQFIGHYKKCGAFETCYKEIEYLCFVHINARLKTLLHCPSLKMRMRYISTAYSYLDTHFPDWQFNPIIKKQTDSAIDSKGRLCWEGILHSQFLLKLAVFCYFFIKHPKPASLPVKTNAKPLSDSRLKELQSIEMDISLEIQKVCQKHNITFFLSEGSLLGAIRHHGFIPWDDDMDISMPRADYDRFLEVAQAELPEHLVLCYHKTLPSYHLPFAKVISTENHGFYNLKDTALGKYRGVYIDIFPLDYTPAYHSRELRNRFRLIRMYRDMLLLKCNYLKKRTIRRTILQIASKFFSNESLHKRIIRLSTKYNSQDCDYMVNFASSYPPPKQVVGKKCYNSGRYELYEGHLMPVPLESEALLQTIYGDYLDIPPVENRPLRHQLLDTKQD